MNRKEYRKQKRKKKPLLKWMLTIAITLLLAFSAYGIFLIKKAEQAANESFEQIEDREKSDLRTEQVEPLTDNVSVLFMGLDNSEKRDQAANNTRSDALILATLNNDDKTVKLVSIPRDSNVYIPEIEGYDKIAHAYAYGGAESTIETVENLFQVPVDYYVRMDFNAFIQIVDALGGITAEVPYAIEESDENDAQNAIQLRPGIQRLNGSEALALARTRHYDNDIERGKRQQMILEAIMQKALSAESVLNYDEVIDAVGNNMKTDLAFQDMRAFLEYAKNGTPEVETITLQGFDDMSTGVYYWQLDQESLASISDTLQNHLEFQEQSDDMTDNAEAEAEGDHSS